ncbi:MAG: heterodisulfide reductase subunit A [Acidiferrobacteraceae bacterium]|jgi:quinone-modifying oxidoreductase subunit QmoA|nr:heterodisulfide reductase subunit A [Acidiferrobacteraceae bacterium]MDP6434494.1 FAD-dependent oxidoreductase [Arenicellales bacterium]MDP6671898.1 FAD-dependent oxidoreductase [Arenicellales bacterium]MDP6724674.1 FAD-dependent oxidoreductase [Arenicellales bacterium]|tara:strand:+ start:22387 stop:23682 length:1296 start_codon:yes stop_codon:yes gene_type:complete
MAEVVATNETIVVVGGGISGMTAALEAAECGKDVVLIEKNPSLGGRVAQLYKYFPKLCRPTCGQEINQRRLKVNPRIKVLTMAEVEAVSGQAGDYSITVNQSPRFVNEKCTACGACSSAVTSEIANPFDYNLSKTKAAYLPFDMAYPQQYVIDPSIVGTEEGEKAKAACSVGAIDLEMEAETINLKAGAIIWATGWKPYDAGNIQPYGYDRFLNVVTSVEFERMMDPKGPTAGKLVRPSDGAEAKSIAFIQCAGSRDRNHLTHCSRICCMATLKQTTYLTEQFGEQSEAEATIYYIDIRAIDRFEEFYNRVQEDEKVSFVKSKVAYIAEDKASGNPILHGVDTEGYNRYAAEHDLVVLAIGMEPSVDINALTSEISTDASGFIQLDEENGAFFGAGCSTNPLDVNRAVQSATAAALRAIQVVNQISRAEAA